MPRATDSIVSASLWLLVASPLTPLRFYNHFRFLSRFFGLHFSLSVTIPTQYVSLETYLQEYTALSRYFPLSHYHELRGGQVQYQALERDVKSRFLVVLSRLFHPFSPSVPSAACFTFSKFVIYPRISLQSLITDPLAIERT